MLLSKVPSRTHIKPCYHTNINFQLQHIHQNTKKRLQEGFKLQVDELSYSHCTHLLCEVLFFIIQQIRAALGSTSKAVTKLSMDFSFSLLTRNRNGTNDDFDGPNQNGSIINKLYVPFLRLTWKKSMNSSFLSFGISIATFSILYQWRKYVVLAYQEN